jgi:hypothetical protein
MSKCFLDSVRIRAGYQQVFLLSDPNSQLQANQKLEDHPSCQKWRSETKEKLKDHSSAMFVAKYFMQNKIFEHISEFM